MNKFETEIMRILEVTELSTETSIENVDSLSRAELCMAVEAELGIELTNAELVKMKTYGEIVDLMLRKTGRK